MLCLVSVFFRDVKMLFFAVWDFISFKKILVIDWFVFLLIFKEVYKQCYLVEEKAFLLDISHDYVPVGICRCC